MTVGIIVKFCHIHCLWLSAFFEFWFLKPCLSPPLPSFITSALKMEDSTFLRNDSIGLKTRRQKGRQHQHHTDRRENLKSHEIYISLNAYLIVLNYRLFLVSIQETWYRNVKIKHNTGSLAHLLNQKRRKFAFLVFVLLRNTIVL
jgi:hypothetical protein